LEPPLEDARSATCNFGFGNVSGSLKRDRQGGVREWIIGRKYGEGKRGGDGCLKLPGVAQRTYKTVMSLDVGGVGGDGPAKVERGLSGLRLGEKVEATFTERGGA
jgi:hypothetical protein